MKVYRLIGSGGSGSVYPIVVSPGSDIIVPEGCCVSLDHDDGERRSDAPKRPRPRNVLARIAFAIGSLLDGEEA